MEGRDGKHISASKYRVSQFGDCLGLRMFGVLVARNWNPRLLMQQHWIRAGAAGATARASTAAALAQYRLFSNAVAAEFSCTHFAAAAGVGLDEWSGDDAGRDFNVEPEVYPFRTLAGFCFGLVSFSLSWLSRRFRVNGSSICRHRRRLHASGDSIPLHHCRAWADCG